MLPGRPESGIPRKCDAACFHEAPNERAANGRAFADVAERRLARRTLLKGAAVAPPLLLAASSPAAASLITGSSNGGSGTDPTLQADSTDSPATSPVPTGESSVSPIAAPDNLAFDELGNVWIATDGQPSTLGLNDTLFAVPAAGAQRGNVQPFLSVPRGAEVCGPEFTPDFESLFVNVQHPGERSAGPEDPQSLWPDGVWPPLPSLVAVTKTGGVRIGS